jgi:N,N'-diacetyllegionaminate synthase
VEPLVINGRAIGDGLPPYVIAEIGSNHNGDMTLCKQLIDAAKRCGAHAAKFQSWSKTSLISKAEFKRKTHYSDKERHFGSLEEMVEKYQFTDAQHREVVSYCRSVGIDFLSSTFSPREVDLVEELGVGCFKIASMDVTHLPLLRYTARYGRPVILSTGMASLSEIERAVETLRDGGAGPIALLHCISIYPPAYQTINLRNIVSLRDIFQLPVGFSDHSVGTAIPLAAMALGACIIEKHFTLDKQMQGWDHWISADETELEAICREGLNVFTALGTPERVVSADEKSKRMAFRRRVVLARAVSKGTALAAADLDYKRPGTGIGPEEADYVIGRVVARDLDDDHELEWSDLL